MSDAAVVLVDTDGIIVGWTAALERLLGHRRDVALGSTLDLIVPSEFRERHWAGFHRATAAGTSWIDGAAAVLPVLCGDGQVRTFAGRLSLVRDAANRVVGAIGTYCVIEDVTETLPALGD